MRNVAEVYLRVRACVRCTAIGPAKSEVIAPAALKLWEFGFVQDSGQLKTQGERNGLQQVRKGLRMTSFCGAGRRRDLLIQMKGTSGIGAQNSGPFFMFFILISEGKY